MIPDSDSEEEEILVYAEFQDNVNITKYRNIHVLGITEKNPIIQMDDTFFTGKFENSLGSYMFFEEDPAPQCLDPMFDKLAERNLKYVCETRKLINMQHAYVTPKEEIEHDIQNQLIQPEDDISPVNFKTVQEALEKFKNEWSPKDTPDSNMDTVSTLSLDITDRDITTDSDVIKDCDNITNSE